MELRIKRRFTSFHFIPGNVLFLPWFSVFFVLSLLPSHTCVSSLFTSSRRGGQPADGRLLQRKSDQVLSLLLCPRRRPLLWSLHNTEGWRGDVLHENSNIYLRRNSFRHHNISGVWRPCCTFTFYSRLMKGGYKVNSLTVTAVTCAAP